MFILDLMARPQDQEKKNGLKWGFKEVKMKVV
jgi:hypothetical protein